MTTAGLRTVLPLWRRQLQRGRNESTSADRNLPDIRVARDAEDDDSDATTVAYLDYGIVERREWSLDDRSRRRPTPTLLSPY